MGIDLSSSVMEHLRAVDPAHEPGSAAWWQAVARKGTPLRTAEEVDEADEAGAPQHRALLFLWRQAPGVPAPVAVCIDVDGHTPHPSEGATRMHRLPGTDVWYWPTRLTADWLGSYAFMPLDPAWPEEPATAQARRQWWRATLQAFGQADPFSPHPATADGWGRPRAVLREADAPARPSGQGAGDLPAGTLRQWTWTSRLLGTARSVWLHQTRASAGETPARPWVLLLDGQAWAGPLGLFPLLDAMTAQGRLPAANYLAVDARDPASREQDMACQPRFWQAMHEELWPAAWRIALRDGSMSGSAGCEAPCLVAGQSLGGLAATYAALHWPHRYPAVLSQSGAFWWPALDTGPEHAWLIRQVRAGLGRRQGLRALFQYGERDPEDMQRLSRQMAEALRPQLARPEAVRAQQVKGGHDWVCWREALLAGLAELLPSLCEPCSSQAH